MLTVSMLALSSVSAGVTQAGALSAQEWDQQYFMQLKDRDKKVVVTIMRTASDFFEQFVQAVDKSGEQFINAYFGLMMLYQQSPQIIVSRIDEYQKRMPIIKAVSFVPTIKDVEKIIKKILPDQPKNEREIKRAINKALRNKQTKEQVRALLTKKNEQVKTYVKYIESNYADLIKELDDFALQMQDMFKDMEEQNN